jgi:glucose-6-phosphate 1-epimerase
VIFTSAESFYQEGKAIRGGVPVCFPWFGPYEGQPAHGFVRNKAWAVESVVQEAEDAVRATFITTSDESTRGRWPHDFEARLSYTVGTKLTMEFQVKNIGVGPFTYSEALHTYLVVGDARQAFVTGLEGAEYRDFPDRTKIARQVGPVYFAGEVDRVYVNTPATCLLVDPVMERRIVVDKKGSNSTTVWNPWVTKSASLPDFGDDEWQRMVCIETVNAFENSVTLAPGAAHSTIACIWVEK